MSTDVPAAINRMSPNYERHGVGLTLESYQTYSTYYDSGRQGRRAGGHGAGARRGAARERRRRRRISAAGTLRILHAVRRTDEVGRTLLRKLWGGQVGDN